MAIMYDLADSPNIMVCFAALAINYINGKHETLSGCWDSGLKRGHVNKHTLQPLFFPGRLSNCYQ